MRSGPSLILSIDAESNDYDIILGMMSQCSKSLPPAHIISCFKNEILLMIGFRMMMCLWALLLDHGRKITLQEIVIFLVSRGDSGPLLLV